MKETPGTARRVFFTAHGKVQGVGFRYFCRDAALSRGLAGWVRNRPDGAVEGEVQGPGTGVEEFLLHLRTGHPWARVDRLESAPAARSGGDGDFEIRP